MDISEMPPVDYKTHIGSRRSRKPSYVLQRKANSSLGLASMARSCNFAGGKRITQRQRSSEIRGDQRVGALATTCTRFFGGRENSIAIDIETFQRGDFAVTCLRCEVVKRALLNRERNLKRSIMPSKTDGALCGIVLYFRGTGDFSWLDTPAQSDLVREPRSAEPV